MLLGKQSYPATNKMPTIVWFTGPVGPSVRHEVEMTEAEATLYYMGLLPLRVFVEQSKRRTNPPPTPTPPSTPVSAN